MIPKQIHRVDDEELFTHKGVEYTIFYRNRELNPGYVRVVDNFLCEESKLNPIRSALSSECIRSTDRVTDLAEFFPHGDNSSKNHRKGVGSFILKKAMRDAMKRGSKLVMMETDKPEMKQFLEKHEFEAISDELYFKILED